MLPEVVQLPALEHTRLKNGSKAGLAACCVRGLVLGAYCYRGVEAVGMVCFVALVMGR